MASANETKARYDSVVKNLVCCPAYRKMADRVL
jgi:hypothetical protein